MTIVDDIALATIAANVGVRLKGAPEKPTFDVCAGAVKRLRDGVMAGATFARGPITRHHLYEELGGQVLHCTYERVVGAASLAFYVSDSFMAESTGTMNLDFMGAFLVSNPYAN